jgi:acetyl-CoA synthetase (ADP-forming)
MLKSIQESPLYRIANPRSIAFFGASNNLFAMGTNLLISLKALEFDGSIYPIHPEQDHVQGLKAYKSVLDLPVAADMAIVVLPAPIVSQILDECGKKGIKHAIVVSGGFKEVGGEGIDLEKELVEIAKKYRICLLGPNCIGVANPHRKLNTTLLPYQGPPGFIGMASQSGSFITQMFHYLSGLGLGFSTAFSVGNEATIDIIDCIEYLDACPFTKVIALYIEGIRRGRVFVETARLIAPHKPIVAFYAGGSETGKRAGFSHTGALAGPDPLYEGMFSQSGVIRARSMTELFDFCWVLGTQPMPKGRRVGIQTHSGGPGAEAADACGRVGLDLPALSQETLDKLAPFAPKTSRLTNPVDLTFIKNHLDYFSNIPRILMEESNIDILLIYVLISQQAVKRVLEGMGVPKDQEAERMSDLIDSQCQSIFRLLETHDKPLVGYTYQSFHEELIRGLLDRGVPVLPGPERAAHALAALADYAKLRERTKSHNEPELMKIEAPQLQEDASQHL